MSLYNTSNVTSANDFQAMSKAINELSDGFLFSTILLMLGLYFLRKGLVNGNYKDALLGTSFISLIIGVLFWGSEMFGIPVIIYPLLLLISSVILKIMPSS